MTNLVRPLYLLVARVIVLAYLMVLSPAGVLHWTGELNRGLRISTCCVRTIELLCFLKVLHLVVS